MSRRQCSGLSSVMPCCEKRSQCANYIHWLDDPRSEFNICTVTGSPFKHFVPLDIPIVLPVVSGRHANAQGSLF
jgi:hypothetical protein